MAQKFHTYVYNTLLPCADAEMRSTAYVVAAAAQTDSERTRHQLEAVSECDEWVWCKPHVANTEMSVAAGTPVTYRQQRPIRVCPTECQATLYDYHDYGICFGTELTTKGMRTGTPCI